jgi:hypothetical protein
MIDPVLQARLDDPVVLDTISTVLSGFIGVWDEPTKEAIEQSAATGASSTSVQDEVLYLRAFTIVLGLGKELGDTKVKSALLDRFQGRVVNLLPDGEAFPGRAADYARAFEAADPPDVGRQIGIVFAQHCGKHGDQRLVELGATQYAALAGVLPQFLLDAIQ